MSNDKELRWVDSECFKYDQFQAFYDHEFDFKITNQKNQNRQSFESAWKHQQKIIDAKDKEIGKLKQYKVNAKSYDPLNDYVQENSEACDIGRHYGDIAVEMLKKKDKEIERYKKALEFYAGQPFESSGTYLDIFDLIKIRGNEIDFDRVKFSETARQALGGENE